METEIIFGASLVDTLRYHLYAHTKIDQTLHDLSVEVAVRRADAEPEAALPRARILAALARFSPTRWTISDAVTEGGRLVVQAETRVQVVEAADLEARAQQASDEQVQLLAPRLRLSNEPPTPQAVSSALRALRERTHQEVLAQIETFTRTTGRSWRIADLDDGLTTGTQAWAGRTNRRGGIPGPARSISSGREEGANRVTLVTRVVLKAETPTLH